MSENTTAKTTADSVKPVELTPEQLEAMFKALPSEFQEALNKVNADIDGNNVKVDSVKAAEAKDEKLIKAEIFEQNPANNKALAKLYSEYLKLSDAAEKLRMQAYALIDTDGLMPKELTAEEIEKLKSEITDSTKELREQANALLKFEEMMPMFKGKISPHIHEIKTRRGAAKTSGTTVSGEGPKRIRFKRITVNDLTEDEKGNKVYGMVNNEPKYTFTFASTYLRKQSSLVKWSAKDLTDAYLSGLDESNLPDEHTFIMTHSYVNGNGERQNVDYTVKCYR